MSTSFLVLPSFPPMPGVLIEKKIRGQIQCIDWHGAKLESPVFLRTQPHTRYLLAYLSPALDSRCPSIMCGFSWACHIGDL